jgi:hypothetical protein
VGVPVPVAVSGAIQSGTIEGAAWGAFSAAVFFGIGQGLADAGPWAKGDFLGTELSGTGFAVKTVSHGLAGGTLSRLQGGKFGHGFVSAAGSAASAPFADLSSAKGAWTGAVVSTVIGGTLSKLSGGKFANGAVTAAFSYAFNSLAHSGQENPAPQATPTDIIVGFDGAGSAELPDNLEIRRLASSIGAELFDASAVIGAPEGAALSYIRNALGQNPSARVYLFGYSAGGAAAISLAAKLGDVGIPVAGLVTIDPHPATMLFGRPSFELSSNVGYALNIFQQNPVTTSWGVPGYPNPFLGGPVTCSACASNPNVNLTGTAAVHTSIVGYAMRNHGQDIRSALGR